jgi:dihydropteroate synthase
MHSKASPKNMQLNPQYEDVVQEVFNFLQQQITLARNAGINTIIGDIGIGFAKTTNHNLTLLKHLDAFDALGVDMLLGISRKRFIGEIIDEPVPSERDAATMLFHYAMLNNRSTKYLRVHNVKLARQMLSVYSEMVGSRRCHSI